MHSKDVLTDAFGRIHETVHSAVEDLSAEELNTRLNDDSNSIAWLIWHLSRVQDDHIADASRSDQVWLGDGWAERLDLGLPPSDTGYGHSGGQVAKVRVPSADLLLGYFDAVHERTLAYVAGLTDEDLDQVIDDTWSPPVTLGVRLVSVIADDLQHSGQAAFVRGVLERL
ncbi:DinB family protein [Streptomyces antnestii]|uniref:DinB family protein n=1 Tax=Streptomyces antnestii TaxID=2494256 RepID=A0A3S2VI08_9ACTN|nr:DinB family protein [Streptomyces sp. San01]RVU27755.1 DinB family protein [Streptomyces sp. San01]